MNIRVIIFILLISVSLIGWTFYCSQSLLTKKTTEAEVQGAFPKDSYRLFMSGNKLMLYALNPEMLAEGEEHFRNYQILKKTEIDTEEHRMDLKTAFIIGMARAKSAPCFNPRHGLRSESADGNIVDLVISFECGKFFVYYGEEKGEGSVEAQNLEGPFNQILQNSKNEIAR